MYRKLLHKSKQFDRCFSVFIVLFAMIYVPYLLIYHLCREPDNPAFSIFPLDSMPYFHRHEGKSKQHNMRLWHRNS